MKNNRTTTILNWALAIVVVVMAVSAMQYFFKTREVRSIQVRIGEAQNRQAFLNNLVAECLEYSKRNPAIDPILESNNLKQKSASSKPGAK